MLSSRSSKDITPIISVSVWNLILLASLEKMSTHCWNVAMNLTLINPFFYFGFNIMVLKFYVLGLWMKYVNLLV